ncbi:MAG TPA: uroporphyrinogen-III synthase [Planctomycetaceae bacterium]|nr:uroporphyrinogen-III synthase [Planctomycetaceae bacterium]
MPDQPRICSFESRRANEMAALIENFGGDPFVAPSMREIPLEDNPQALAFAERLFAGEIDIVVLMTGVGTRQLAEVVATRAPLEDFQEALRHCTIAIRGPKPAAVLKEWNVPYAVRAPEPNTWRELLDEIQTHLDLPGKRIAVQEYGISNPEFLQALKERGASVESVVVYRWALPEDRAPLERAIRMTCDGEFEALLFTSAQQIRNVLQFAEELGLLDRWKEAASQTLIASIGPTCSETLEEFGFTIGFEASPPKMGHLVRGTLSALAQRRDALLREDQPM